MQMEILFQLLPFIRVLTLQYFSFTPPRTPTPNASPISSPNATPGPNIVSLNMAPAPISTTVGSTFSVKLNVNSSTDQLSAAELHLLFDKNKLQAQSLTAGTTLPV